MLSEQIPVGGGNLEFFTTQKISHLPISSPALAAPGYELGGCLIVTRHASIDETRTGEKGGQRQNAQKVSKFGLKGKGLAVKFIFKIC